MHTQCIFLYINAYGVLVLLSPTLTERSRDRFLSALFIVYKVDKVLNSPLWWAALSVINPTTRAKNYSGQANKNTHQRHTP